MNAPAEDMNRSINNESVLERAPSHVNRNRNSFWTSSALAIGGLVLFTLLVEVVVTSLRITLSGTTMLLASLVLTVVPVGLWMTAFYLLDRDEPEPRGHVLTMMLLGGLLALVIAIPIVRNLFAVQDWLGRTPWYSQLLGSIFIIGFTQEFCKYAAVRYTLYLNREFDERVDGIIYGAAAGLGFGTVLALQHLISAGGAQLGMAAVRVAVTTLAQASFGGLTGYFIGRAKFDNMGKWWLPMGLTLSAVINGVVTWLLGEVSTQGLVLTPLYGLVLAAAVAVIVFGVLAILSRRLARQSTL